MKRGTTEWYKGMAEALGKATIDLKKMSSDPHKRMSAEIDDAFNRRFWLSNHPLNHWGCRCVVEPTKEAKQMDNYFYYLTHRDIPNPLTGKID